MDSVVSDFDELPLHVRSPCDLQVIWEPRQDSMVFSDAPISVFIYSQVCMHLLGDVLWIVALECSR